MPDMKAKKTTCFLNRMYSFLISNLQTMRFPKHVSTKMISEKSKTWSMIPNQTAIPAETAKS